MATKSQSKELIKMDNRLAETPFKYTQEEMDILFYVMSIVRSDCTDYQFSVSDIEQISGKEIHNTRFRTSIMNLARKAYENFHSDDKWEAFFVFKSIKYDNAIIRISLNEEILPLLCNLKSNYTKVQLASGFKLSGKYSKRLYLLMCRWKNLGGHLYEIMEVANILQYEINENDRDAISNFKKMISRSIKDINENTDIFLSEEWIKTGRKTTHLKFSIRKGRLKDDEISLLADPELGKMKTLLMVRGGVPEAIVERLYSEGCDYKTAEMVYNQANDSVMKNRVKVNSPGAYLIECFRNKGYLMSDEERNTKIRIYREMIQNGVKPEDIKPVLAKLGIFIEEVLI